MIKYLNKGNATTMAMIISAFLVCGGVLGYQYYFSRKAVPVVQNEHEKFAGALTQGYLEAYKFEDVVLSKRIKSYSINEINIDIEKDECFGFIIDLSIEAYKSNSDWTAGNGKIEGNWIRNKVMYMNAVKRDNGYYLKIVGTGRVDDDCTNGSPITPVELIK